MISYLEKYKSDDLRYGITLLPVPEAGAGPVYTYGDPKNMVIFSTSQNRRQAWEFIKFMTDRAADRRLLELTGQIPVRRNLTRDSLYAEYFEQNPRLKIFARQMPLTVGTDHTIYLQEIFDIISQEYESVCLYQAQEIPEAIEAMTRRVTMLVERESQGKGDVE